MLRTAAAIVSIGFTALAILFVPSASLAEEASGFCRQSGSNWSCRSKNYAVFHYQCKYAIRTDGCSTNLQGKLSRAVFNKYKNFFYDACDFHDVCYGFLSKKACDGAYYRYMTDLCRDDKLLERGRCKATALVFYQAVVHQSRHKENWKAAQKNSEDKGCRKL